MIVLSVSLLLWGCSDDDESINNGNRGNYENGGKAFFDWILML